MKNFQGYAFPLDFGTGNAAVVLLLVKMHTARPQKEKNRIFIIMYALVDDNVDDDGMLWRTVWQ